MENQIAGLVQLPAAVGVLHRRDDLRRIEQDDQMLGEMGRCVLPPPALVNATEPVSAIPDAARTSATSTSGRSFFAETPPRKSGRS
jgi:hypothetical protein